MVFQFGISKRNFLLFFFVYTGIYDYNYLSFSKDLSPQIHIFVLCTTILHRRSLDSCTAELIMALCVFFSAMAGLYRGEYVLNGVVYDGRCPKENVEFIRDQMTFRSSDIVLASFPKSGKLLLVIGKQSNLTRLTHGGRLTHICVGKSTIIGSDNGLSPGRRQAIIWNNAGILSIGLFGTKFSEIFIEILTFSFKKMCLKVSSAKWRPFCLGLNVLTRLRGSSQLELVEPNHKNTPYEILVCSTSLIASLIRPVGGLSKCF